MCADERTCGCVSVCVRHVTAGADVHQCMCAGVYQYVCVQVRARVGVYSAYVCGQLNAQVGVSDCVWRLCACDRRTGRDMCMCLASVRVQ